MQVRYVFDSDLQQARARLAHSLIPWLAEHSELKAMPAVGKAAEAWKPLYSHLSRPLPQPRAQLFHGPLTAFKAHPLQWNVLVDPSVQDLQASQQDATHILPAGVDEVWVFSAEARQGLLERGVSSEKIRLLPLATGSLQPDGSPLPMELAEPRVLLCSLADFEVLSTVLSAYLPAFAQSPDVTLALHLNTSDPHAEEHLLALLESLSTTLGVSLESLNLESWIGPLEPGVYAELVQRADLLLAPADSLQALEALRLGTRVLGLADSALGIAAEISPGSLQAALAAPAPQTADWQTRFGLAELGEAILTELRRIDNSVDFEARDRAWRADEQAQQGRKQKYSLFHSDYQEPEMQARRQWHLRYARYFDQAPGDVMDIGCGSGIFLEIMRDLELPACGVDPDPDMVEVCTSLGLQAIAGDERQLAQWQNESLGGIHASHVIEHIDGDRAIALIENAFRCLLPGGRLLVRTPNWRNETVRHEGFWLDITHIRPYPLPLLKQVFEDAGFIVDQMGFEEFGWQDTFIVGSKPVGGGKTGGSVHG